jgi:hypothetical protein
MDSKLLLTHLHQTDFYAKSGGSLLSIKAVRSEIGCYFLFYA